MARGAFVSFVYTLCVTVWAIYKYVHYLLQYIYESSYAPPLHYLNENLEGVLFLNRCCLWHVCEDCILCVIKLF